MGNHDDRPVLVAATLCGLFRLTPAEADLAVALAKGESLEEIAARRGV